MSVSREYTKRGATQSRHKLPEPSITPIQGAGLSNSYNGTGHVQQDSQLQQHRHALLPTLYNTGRSTGGPKNVPTICVVIDHDLAEATLRFDR